MSSRPPRPPAVVSAHLQLDLPWSAEGAAAPPAALRLFRHPRGNRELQLGEHRIGYLLRRARRRSIGFVVGEEGLAVSAPRWIGQADIDAALLGKARWIVRKLLDHGERLGRLAAARVDWRDGAELPYLGAPLRLVLDTAQPGVRLDTSTTPPQLRVGLPAPADPARLRDTVQRWLQQQALQHYAARCAHFAPALQVQVRRLQLSAARTRWGSATSDGTIRLHWRLLHFAPALVDYVVVHELAHLREMNHSPAFWAVVRSVLPDFEQARDALKAQVLPALE